MNKLPPHLDTEGKIIGVLLMKPDLILSLPLEAKWFEQNKHIISAMLSVAGNGISIDIFSVSKQLGGKYLNDLIEYQKNSFANHNNYPIYLADIKTEFESRLVRKAIEDARKSLDNKSKPAEVINNLINASMQLSSNEADNFTHTAVKAMSNFIDKLTEIYDSDGDSHAGIMTGISSIDNVIGGIQKSDMTIVGARPAVGKTAYGLSVIRNLAKQGKKVGFFSTEMASDQVMARLTALETGIPAVKFRTGALVEEDFPKLTMATNNIAKWDLRICDKPVITVGELTMQARAWMADGGIDFIVVDYLTRLHPDKSRNNQTLDVGDIATGLKNLARILHIPVMVLAQLNRQSEQRADKRPVMADLRDSGVVEQEADQILLLHRPDDGEPEIIVEKNRHGATGAVRCSFELETMRWGNRND